MNTSRRVACLATSVLLVTSAVAPLSAQNAGQTPSQFYLAYRAAFDGARSIDELLPFLSRQSAERVKATPASDRPKMFELVKRLGTFTAVKVLKETKNGDGATLSVEGVDSGKTKSEGTIEILKEGGAWKLGGETWSASAS